MENLVNKSALNSLIEALLDTLEILGTQYNLRFASVEKALQMVEDEDSVSRAIATALLQLDALILRLNAQSSGQVHSHVLIIIDKTGNVIGYLKRFGAEKDAIVYSEKTIVLTVTYNPAEAVLFLTSDDDENICNGVFFELCNHNIVYGVEDYPTFGIKGERTSVAESSAIRRWLYAPEDIAGSGGVTRRLTMDKAWEEILQEVSESLHIKPGSTGLKKMAL